jgi:hypothetical protein
MKRLRFSLKTLFALVTVLGIVCGWFAFKLSEARHQKRIVAQIRDMHVSVDYDWDSGRPLNNLEQNLIEVFGIDSCSNVNRVVPKGMQIAFDDARLEQLIPLLKQLPKLKQLNLGVTNISDAHLRELSQLQSLQSITLTGTRVTDQAVKELKVAMPQTVIFSDGTDPIFSRKVNECPQTARKGR